jgi:Tfp pilus assembly protein PilV
MDQLTRNAAARRAGMTLVEVMIAAVLLSFGLLAMLALQLHAMRGGQVGRHYTQAAQIARDRMELLQRLPWTHADVLPTGGWVADGAAAAMVEHETLGQTQEMAFTREYRVVADAAQPTELREIDVRVTWYEANDPPAPAPPRRRYAITSVRFNDGT